MIRVSVVVPIKNEQTYIRGCLESLLNQSIPADWYEVIAVDGNSVDETVPIIKDMQKTRRNLLMIKNSAGTTPVGMNLGIQKARGDVIVIAGAHATYPAHFLEKSLDYLKKTNADVVGGPIRAVLCGAGLSTRLISVILGSVFGVGNSQFRTSTKEGFVDTVPFGAYRREIFDRVGLFNERLTRNQDNDLSARVRAVGGKIYLTPELVAQYHLSVSFPLLLRKVYKNSQWHFVSVQENRGSMSLRHFAPLLLLLILFASIASFSFTPAGRWILAVILAAYISVGMGFALRHARELNAAGTFVFPFACLAFHLAYGTGTLVGLLQVFNSYVQQTDSKVSNSTNLF